MIMIAQRHVQGSDGTELLEKSKEMRNTFRHVEQVSGDENPIWAKLLDSGNNLVMSRVISVKMEIGEVDGTTTGENGMTVSEEADFMIGQPPFPMWGKAENSIEGFTQTIADT